MFYIVQVSKLKLEFPDREEDGVISGFFLAI